MSIIKHVTLQKIVAHDFRYDPHMSSSQCVQGIELTEKFKNVIVFGPQLGGGGGYAQLPCHTFC